MFKEVWEPNYQQQELKQCNEKEQAWVIIPRTLLLLATAQASSN